MAINSNDSGSWSDYIVLVEIQSLTQTYVANPQHGPLPLYNKLEGQSSVIWIFYFSKYVSPNVTLTC